MVSAGRYTVKTRKAGYLKTTRVVEVRPQMLMDRELNYIGINIPLVKSLE